MYRLYHGDGSVYTAHTQVSKLVEELDQIYPGDGAYLDVNQERFDDCYLRLLKRDLGSLAGLLSPDLLKLLLYRADRPLYHELSRFFKSDKSRLAFTFQAKYIGMSPYDAPSFFTLLSFIEYRYGIWHPMGGFYRMLVKMMEMAKAAGAQLHLGSPVEEILVESGQARGVKVGGEKIDADAVVVNADLPYAMQSLIRPEHRRKYTDNWFKKARYSCSTVMFYWGMDTQYPQLDHHNIFLAQDYMRNLQYINQTQRVDSDSSFYVWNPSVLDPSFAPDGHSILYILFPSVNLDAHVAWEEAVDRLRETALQVLGNKLGDIRPHIRTEQVITPVQWQTEFNLHRAATFSLAHNIGQIGPFRPPNRDRDIVGLYWSGGGTHPGSGLPTIFQGAQISVDLLDRDLAPSLGYGRAPAVPQNI